jgi:hypothetical protein
MAVAFDTLRYTQKLEEVGVSHEQAVRHAELARDMILSDLVRDDVFRQEIASVRTELRAVEDRLDLKLRTEIANAKSEIVRTIVIAQLATILVVVLGLIFR